MDLMQLAAPADERYIIHIRSKGQGLAGTTQTAPAHKRLSKARYLGSGPAGVKYYHDNDNWSSTSNHSALFADNDFVKKSRMLSDIINKPAKHHSITTVVVIASVFLFVTITVTAAIFIFCRKKNSVYAFQKSEQEDDGEYELDELNTDMEYTETDLESDAENQLVTRRKSYPLDIHDDSRQRIADFMPPPRLFHNHHKCHCQHEYNTGHCSAFYQQITIAAMMEKHSQHGRLTSDSEDSATEGHPPPRKRAHYHQHYHNHNELESDLDSDQELLNSAHMPRNKQRHRATALGKGKMCRTQGPKNYKYNSNNNCSSTKTTIDKEQQTNGSLFSLNKSQCYESKCTSHKGPGCDCKSCGLFVQLPPLYRKDNVQCEKDNKNCYVDLPPKSSDDRNSSDHCTIDLHPENTRPTSLQYGYFQVKSHHVPLTPQNDLPSRAPMRTHSVTDNLSELSQSTLSPGQQPQSCPQTPMTENLSQCADLRRHESRTSYEGRHSSRRARYSSHLSSRMMSSSSVDQETGVSYVLSNPFSSIVSLLRDSHDIYEPVCEEEDRSMVSHSTSPLRQNFDVNNQHHYHQQEVPDDEQSLVDNKEGAELLTRPDQSTTNASESSHPISESIQPGFESYVQNCTEDYSIDMTLHSPSA